MPFPSWAEGGGEGKQSIRSSLAIWCPQGGGRTTVQVSAGGVARSHCCPKLSSAPVSDEPLSEQGLCVP